MPGRTPKSARTRQRKNRSTTASNLVDTNPLNEGVPELPVRRDDQGRFVAWRPEVVAWWNDVWESPMSSEFVRVDLHGLIMLAEMMDRYWHNPSSALATEIRLQRQCFGLTPIDRRRLQWEVQRGEEAERKRHPHNDAGEDSGVDKRKDPRAKLKAVK